jgi:hypothetical protein
MRIACFKPILALAAALLLGGAHASAGALDGAARTGTDIVPILKAPDQTGGMRSFETLKGPRGLILLISRSVHW